MGHYAEERAEQRELERRSLLELREVLDDKPVRLIVEYLADRLHCVGGNRRMSFRLEQGSLRQSEFGHERLRNEELEVVGRRAAPAP